MFKVSIFLALCLTLAVSKVFPPPVVEQYHQGELQLENVCSFYHFPSGDDLIEGRYYFDKVVKRLNKNKECSRQLVFNEKMHVPLKVSAKKEMKKEAYGIEINSDGVSIEYGGYSGYIYALESLSQIIEHGKLPYVSIRDGPVVEIRGIMIDTARHFLPMRLLYETIDAMMYNKLSVLHWHIVD